MTERAELNAEESLQLWYSAMGGNQASRETLLRVHQDLIFRFCYSQLGDQSLAIEATQETALRLIKGLTNFQGQGKLSTWILGIANNVCREMRRQNSRWKQTADPDKHWAESNRDSQQPSSARLIKLEQANEVQQAIAGLPERQRNAIVLRFFESLTVAEVAQVMQISPGTVKATLNQAMKKLKLKLGPEFD